MVGNIRGVGSGVAMCTGGNPWQTAKPLKRHTKTQTKTENLGIPGDLIMARLLADRFSRMKGGAKAYRESNETASQKGWLTTPYLKAIRRVRSSLLLALAANSFRGKAAFRGSNSI
jgi:hypothetical protein